MALKTLNFNVGDPHLRPPEIAIEAYIDAISSGKYDHYANKRGLQEYLDRVASFYNASYGVSLDPEKDIIATSGATEGIFLAISTILHKEKELIIPRPTYSGYEEAARSIGGKIIYVDSLDDFSPDIDSIGSSFNERTAGIVLCNPNNPTGRLYRRNELLEFLKIADENNAFVISDENYSSIVYSEKGFTPISSIGRYSDSSITIGGLSKAFSMTGWRLGYLIANPESISEFERRVSVMRGPLNAPLQHAGAAALSLGLEEITRRVLIYKKSRDVAIHLLRNAEFQVEIPEGGFDTFPRIPPSFRSSSEFVECMADQTGVLLNPGYVYGPKYDDRFRMVFCKDPAEIEEGICLMEEALKRRRRQK